MRIAPRTLTTEQVAEILQLSPVTLRRWRQDGKGPAFEKDGAKVWYLRSVVEEWIEEQIANLDAEIAHRGLQGARS